MKMSAKKQYYNLLHSQMREALKIQGFFGEIFLCAKINIIKLVPPDIVSLENRGIASRQKKNFLIRQRLQS